MTGSPNPDPLPSYTPRPWLCHKCGWELGRVVRPGRIRRLEVWSMPSISRAEHTVLVTLEGDGEVRCLHCDSIQKWQPSADSLRELILRHSDKAIAKP
jgi:hypothetical protein